MRVELKHFDVASLVKLSFVIYAILGIVVGIVYVIIALVVSSFIDLAGAFEGAPMFRLAATGVGLLLVPLFALFYGVIGAIAAFIFAVAYNLVSKALGGIKVTLEAEGTKASPPGLSEQVNMRL